MQNFSAGSFIGVNEKQLGALKTVITNYYNKCVKTLDTMNTNISMNYAFKGTALQREVKNYIKKVKEEGEDWLSQILRYNAAIDQRLAEMKSQQTKLGSVLQSGSKKVSSQTSRYTYSGGGQAS